MPRILRNLSIFLLFSSFCSCQGPDNLNDYFNNLANEGDFNGNVLIVQHDTVRFQGSFGYSNNQRDTLLTADHLFAIGSIQKEFPAVTLMHLKEKGLLMLDDKITNYIDDLPDWANQITIRHLLQYSSGLPEVDWQRHFNDGIPNEDKVLDDLNTIKELEFVPGSDYIYSNYNNFLQVKIIEAITRKSFENNINEVFADAGITGIKWKSAFPFSGSGPIAMPFNQNFEADDLQYALKTAVANSAGLHQWFKAVDAFNILSSQSVRTLSEEAISGDNIQAPLGRAEWENERLILHLHHGSSHNYEALVRHYKPDGIYIILLTNRKEGNLHDIADFIYNIL